MTSMVPRMLRSIWTQAVVRSRTRLGSSGECGSHSGSSDQPGTSVQCRSDHRAHRAGDVDAAAGDQQPVEHDPRPLAGAQSSVTARMLRASGRLLYQSSSRITGRVPSAARSFEPVAGVEVEVQLLLVGAAVRDLDDAVGPAAAGPAVVLPGPVRVHDPLVRLAGPDPVDLGVGTRSRGPRGRTRRRPCRRRTRSGSPPTRPAGAPTATRTRSGPSSGSTATWPRLGR